SARRRSGGSPAPPSAYRGGGRRRRGVPSSGSSPSVTGRSFAPRLTLPEPAPASPGGGPGARDSGTAVRVELWVPGLTSALALLVPRIRADDHHPAVPADDPA